MVNGNEINMIFISERHFIRLKGIPMRSKRKKIGARPIKVYTFSIGTGGVYETT